MTEMPKGCFDWKDIADSKVLAFSSLVILLLHEITDPKRDLILTGSIKLSENLKLKNLY